MEHQSYKLKDVGSSPTPPTKERVSMRFLCSNCFTWHDERPRKVSPDQVSLMCPECKKLQVVYDPGLRRFEEETVALLEQVKRKTRGRPSYPPEAMLQAYLACGVNTTPAKIVERLRSDPVFAKTCGFKPKYIPNARTFWRFINIKLEVDKTSQPQYAL